MFIIALLLFLIASIVLICKLLWIKASAKLLNAKFAVRATDKYTITHVVCEVYLKHLNITFLPGQWWNKQNIYFIMQIASINIEGASLKGYFNCKSKQPTSSVLATSQITLAYGQHTLKKMIFALCSISLIKMSSYNITLGKNGPNLILLNINNVI